MWVDRAARVRSLIAASILVLAIVSAVAAIAVTTLGRRSVPVAQTVAAQTQQYGAAPSAAEFTLSPEQLRALTAEQARALNARLAVATESNPPAAAFSIPVANAQDFERAVNCMTAAIYYEAANEPAAGQAAVAQVVINRSRHPAYPSTICGVVFQGSDRVTGCQFSFTCDGALLRRPALARWETSRAVAISALSGSVAAAVGTATHYHADYVSPYWAPRLSKIGQIGAHIFYRWQGVWGRPPAFARAYAGGEPVITKLAALASEGFAFDITPEVIEILTTDATDAALSGNSVLLSPAVAPAPTILSASPIEEMQPDVSAPVVVAVAAPAPPRIASTASVRDPGRPDTVAFGARRDTPRVAAPSAW